MSISQHILNEIDWEEQFSDTKKQCINPTELVKRLNDIVNNRKLEDKFGNPKYKKQSDYVPSKLNQPFIHKRSSFVQKTKNSEKKKTVDKYDYIDVDYFIKKITTPPSSIIKDSNEKMQHTGNRYQFVYNTGIPALRGIVYDIENEKFYVINTCPTAYTCATTCYAMSGDYIRFPNVSESNTRTLNYMLNYPKKYLAQMEKELKFKCKKHNAFIKKKIGGGENRNSVLVRFNDSGDFFSQSYYDMMVSTLRKLRKKGYNVKGYAHTKIAEVANGMDNDVMSASFSTDATPSELKKVRADVKRSTTIPRSLMKQFDLYDYDDAQRFLDVVAVKYNVDRDKLYFFDDYEDISTNDYDPNNMFSVVVTNKDGDDGAYRLDVNQIFHLEH
jgi:hypothetical protein